MPVIPGLPPDLERVPEAPFSDKDPWAAEKRAEYGHWRSRIPAYRALRRKECAHGAPGFLRQRKIELEKCRRSTAYFVAVWCSMFEPRRRLRKKGYGGEFIPFAKQVELFEAFERCLLEEDGGPLADLAVAKSRDVGASWCMCAKALHDWIFEPETEIRLLSYKEDLVDSKKPDSLFWKIDFMLKDLPDWMAPSSYNRTKLLLVNEDNSNVIAGESTTTRSGRAGRCTWLGMDECSFFPEFGDIWTATVAAAESRFAISSISLAEGPDFFRLAMSDEVSLEDRPSRFKITWFDHPFHDDAWLENERKRYKLKPEGFHQEVRMDPFTLSRLYCYPMAQHIKVDPSVVYNPRFQQWVSIDPGVRDECVLVFGQINPVDGRVEVLDSYVDFGKPAAFYARILTGELEPEERRDPVLYRLARWCLMRHERGCLYVGDPAGWQSSQASAESVYQVFGRHKIKVRRDHNREGVNEQKKRAAISPRGRREAVYELLMSMAFANTDGARYVLQALKENRFQHEGDGQTITEDTKMLHDWTSHPVSCIEFLGVNLRIMMNLRDFYAAGGARASNSRSTANLRSVNRARNVRAQARLSSRNR